MQSVTAVSSKSVTLPILSNVLIRAKEGVVELTTTNLEIAVVATVRAKVETPGVYTVPAKTLADYVGLLSDERVEMQLSDDQLLVSSSKSKTKIKGESAEEFPVVPEAQGGVTLTFAAKALKDALSKVVFSVSRSDVRPELSGVLFHANAEGSKGVLTMAATDSFRLSEKRIAIQNDQKETEVRCIVPSRTIQELIRAITASDQELIEVIVAEGQLVAKAGDTHIVSRLIEGNYPDYRQIIPQDFGATARLQTGNLAQQMRAASLFSTTGVNAVSFQFAPEEKNIKLAAANTQLGEFSSALEGEVSGQEHTVLLNHRYVLDGLSHMDSDKVNVSVVNADSPCVVTPEGKSDFVYIVMPIKQ